MDMSLAISLALSRPPLVPPSFAVYRASQNLNSFPFSRLPTSWSRSGTPTVRLAHAAAGEAATANFSDDDSFNGHINSNSGAMLDVSELGPSPELRELAHLQLGLLVAALEARVGEIVAETAVRCAVYCRNPASLAAGSLQLQLVAASDGREAEAARQRQDLILGIPTADGQAQEHWLVEQNLIVLPDSGGLVLPLAHHGFLVGLLVVERCGSEVGAAGELGPDGLPVNSNTRAAPPTALQPPACAIFQPADMALVKQAGAALGLACAMDLRSSLESAGHQMQKRMVQGLVSQVRKPLGTLRTLSAMLTPRLQEGEPERDMGEGILAQGQRLGELVMQLQSALAPPVPAILPSRGSANSSIDGMSSLMPMVLLDAASNRSVVQLSTRPQPQQEQQQQQQQQQQPPAGAASATSATPTSSAVRYPALPSSTIGSDWGSLSEQATTNSLSSKEDVGSGSSNSSDNSSDNTSATTDVVVEQQNNNNNRNINTNIVENTNTNTNVDLQFEELCNLPMTLLPLLSAVANFAAVSGVIVAPVDAQGQIQSQHTVPDVSLPIEPLLLKRMLSQLLDGMMACSARGDCIEVAVEQQPWQGRPGVVILVRLLQAVGSGSVGASVASTDLDGYLTLEVGPLTHLARVVGGWFELQVDEGRGSVWPTTALGVATAGTAGSVSSALWLPIAAGLPSLSPNNS